MTQIAWRAAGRFIDMRIVFFGNCQMRALDRMYATLVAPHSRDRVTWIDARQRLDPADLERINAAHVIVEQLADFQPKNDISGMAPSARRIVVPVAGAGFLWPFSGLAHPKNGKRYPGYEPFRAEMGDSWLIKELRTGCTAEEAASRYLELDMAKAGHLDRRFELLMEAQRGRDAATDYDIAGIIERHFRTEQLFLTAFHPTLRIARYLADQFLQRLGTPAALRERVERLMTDTFYFKFALPVHPGVARHFKLDWANADTGYRFFDEGLLTFAEYARRYAACDANAELDRALRAVNARASQAGRALEAAMADGSNSPWAMVGLARVRIREQRYAEAERLLNAAISIAEDCGSATLHLGECLAALGRPAEAEAAFRTQLRLRPFVHAHHAGFARFLAGLGRFGDARAALAGALDLQPGRAGYMALDAEWARLANPTAKRAGAQTGRSAALGTAREERAFF